TTHAYFRWALFGMQCKKSRTIFTEVVEVLETQPGIRDIELKEGIPVTISHLDSWEKVNDCSLPEDLKQFYLAHDGATLNWSYTCNDVILRLGLIHVNQLAKLRPFSVEPRASGEPSAVDLDVKDTEGFSPSFGGHNCRVLPLNYCSTCGHVCLVYRIPEGGASPFEHCNIWLLDLSLSWHLLCRTFSDYLRLAAVHLGLRQWPYALTSVGLSPLYQKWFHLFVPKRYELDCSKSNPTLQPEEINNMLDVTKLLEIQSKGTLPNHHRSAK
ncbi:hypothetical protein EMCRGX_G030055, partial [Ephydatia muelleri]